MTDDRITIRLSPDVAEALNRYLADEGGKVRTRQDAFRYITREWLVHNGYLSAIAAAPSGRYKHTARILPPARRSAPECRVGDILVLQCRVSMLQNAGRLTVELPGMLPRVSVETSGEIEFSKGPGPRRRPTLEVGDFITLRCQVAQVLSSGHAIVRVPGLPTPATIRIPADAAVIERPQASRDTPLDPPT